MICIYDKFAQGTYLGSCAGGNQVSALVLAGKGLREVPWDSTYAEEQTVSPQVPRAVSDRGCREQCTGGGEEPRSKFLGNVVCSLIFLRTEGTPFPRKVSIECRICELDF